MKSRIMTNWVCIWENTGATESSQFVLVDPAGIQEAMGIVVNACSKDGCGAMDDCDELEELRFDLDRCTYINGILSDNVYNPSYASWFNHRLDRVANANGIERAELIDALCSPDPVARFQGYEALAIYHGWHEFDHCPNWYSGRKGRKSIRRAMARWEHQAGALHEAWRRGMSKQLDGTTFGVIADWLEEGGGYWAKFARLLRVGVET